MTSIFSDGALHPGRDANDSAWMIVRRPEDWAGATLTNVIVDHAVPALVLTPSALASEPGATIVVSSDGTSYRSDPDGDAVWRKRACDPGWTLFVGRRGTETGKLRRPLGLALDEGRGMLAIADSQNHRVQVVRAETGEPIVVLGCVDMFGRGVADGDRRALDEPVAVAFGGRRLAIADRRRGVVHVYDDRFELVAVIAPRPPLTPSTFTPHPVAVAIAGCIVWVIDAGWSIPVAYGLDGERIEGAGTPPATLADWLAHARSAARGEVLLGPIDGKTEDLAWHRVIVDAIVPEGAAVEIQTFASDDPIAPFVIPWAPAKPQRIPIAGVESRDGETARPVLSDHGRWTRKQGEPYTRTSRPLGRLAGTGPNASAGFAAPWTIARRLRELDTIELRRLDGTTVARPIAAIAGRPLHATVRGDLVAYGAGSSLVLIERDGDAPLGGPRTLATFAAGDSLDASAALADGTLYDLPASHAIAALVRDGDVLQVTDGLATTTVVVDAVDSTDATIVLSALVAPDFSTSDLRLVTAVDRLVVDQLGWTDDVPAGEAIFVHDAVAGTLVIGTLRWAELDTNTLWLDPVPAIPYATWTHFTLPEPQATDRGRYLWVRIVMLGAVEHPGDASAFAGPVIRSLRLLLPRLSYLRYLPQVYSRRDDGDPSGSLFLERLLALPESYLTDVEARYEDVARQLNPVASSPDWLRFIAGWYALAFDPSWPIERRRELVLHAHELFASRGTVEGMRRYLEIYLGTSPSIIEGFQWRVTPPPVVGGQRVLGRVALGASTPDGLDGGLPHHFSIWVFGDGGPCGADVTAKAARAIIESIKPAHTTYDLHVVDGSPRVGISTNLGVDMVLVGGEAHPPIGLVSRPPAVLGQMSLPLSRSDAGVARLEPIPLDHDFTLT